KEAYQDPTTEDTNWVVVDLKPLKKLKKPVPLTVIKADKRLTEMALVRLGRLSVQPVTDEEWKIVMELAGVEFSIHFHGNQKLQRQRKLQAGSRPCFS
ncbi:MAG: EVE domain-containing protein, partial [Pedobacter sp.]